jgi:hypothetical protein
MAEVRGADYKSVRGQERPKSEFLCVQSGQSSWASPSQAARMSDFATEATALRRWLFDAASTKR